MRILGKIIAVLFSIIYFFLMTAFMILTFAMNFVSGDYYANVFKSLDLKEIKISDLGELKEGFDLGEDANLEDVLVQGLTESGVSDETAKAIIDNKEIREVLGNFIGEYINYNLGGEEPTISRSEVETIYKNKDVIAAIGHTPTDEEIDMVYDNLLEVVEEIKEGKPEENGNEEGVVNSRW